MEVPWKTFRQKSAHFHKYNIVFWKLWSNKIFGSNDAFNLKLFGGQRATVGRKKLELCKGQLISE